MSSSPAAVSPSSAQGQQPTTPTLPSPSTRSPSRNRLSTTLAALSAKIANTLTLTPEHERASDHPHSGSTSPGVLGPTMMTPYSIGTKGKLDGDEVVSLSTMSAQERSQSRGREAFQSSGRGGVGNIRRASVSRDARPDSGPDDFSTTRGREPRSAGTDQKIFSTGRGGAGNIRSPSRDVRSAPAPAVAGAASTVDAVEDQVLRSHKAAEHIAVHSTGRGGIGNMASSRSRSRARDSPAPSLLHHHQHHHNGGTHTPSLHSTGRGGAGNILPGHAPSVAEADEGGIKPHLHTGDEIHSTGRGGSANIVHGHIPPVEHTHHHHLHGEGYESTGRGGAGNIVHS